MLATTQDYSLAAPLDALGAVVARTAVVAAATSGSCPAAGGSPGASADAGVV
jgi:hypothetical protein